MTNQTRRTNLEPAGTPLRIAGACMIVGPLIYLAAEAFAAVAFRPTYSYAINYISDLGVSDCGGVFDGRSLCSPRYAYMNVALILVGTLLFAAFALGAVVRRTRRS